MSASPCGEGKEMGQVSDEGISSSIWSVALIHKPWIRSAKSCTIRPCPFIRGMGLDTSGHFTREPPRCVSVHAIGMRNSEPLPGQNYWESSKIRGSVVLARYHPLHSLKRSVRVLCVYGSGSDFCVEVPAGPDAGA